MIVTNDVDTVNGMSEENGGVVKKEVDCEFKTGLDDEALATVVVIDYVVDYEWVVRTRCRRDEVEKLCEGEGMIPVGDDD